MAIPTRSLRLSLIACAGVATFYLSAQWAGAQRGAGDSVVEAVAHAAPRAEEPPVATTPAAAVPPAPDRDATAKAVDRARSIPRSKGDPFTRLSWLPAPPPPAPAPAPPPPPKPAEPVAPPLPFVFVGMLERGKDKPEAFLAKGDVLLVVSVGDMLDNNTYRVESLNATELVMTYMPLNTKQSLNVSGGSK